MSEDGFLNGETIMKENVHVPIYIYSVGCGHFRNVHDNFAGWILYTPFTICLSPSCFLFDSDSVPAKYFVAPFK